MAALNASLLLTLRDQVSGPLGRLRGAFRGFNQDAKRLSGGLGGVGMVGGLATAAIGYVGLREGIIGSVAASNQMQSALTEIGIKASLTESQLDQLRSRITALSPATNQTTSDLIAGVDTMVGLGLSAKEAADAIPAIGKAATATGATMADLSAASVSAMQNLKVSAADLPKMLDAMAAAGNAGAFELRDMATYFPSLGAAYQGLGQQGVGAVTDLAAALQIVRKGTGDSASAATNLSNLLQKVNAPATRTAFKKMGVNLGREMEKATKRGLTPIEAIAEVTATTLKGDLGKLGDLFQDSQVQQALRPLIQNMQEYRAVREEAAKATGTVDAAYAKRMEDNAEKVKAFQLRLEQLRLSIGARMSGPLAGMAEHFTKVFDSLDKRVTVLDRSAAAVRGFMGGWGQIVGLGGTGGKSLTQQIEEAIFGTVEENPSKRADELGKVAYKYRQAGENFAATWKSLAGGNVGGASGALKAGLGDLQGAFSFGTLASIGLGALTLNRLSTALLGLSLGKGLRLGALAWGLSALATSGTDMSAVDWALLGVGLTTFSGGIAKTATALTSMGTAIGALSRFMPLLSLPFLSGDTPKDRRNAKWEDDPRTDAWLDQWAEIKRSRGGPLTRGRRRSRTEWDEAAESASSYRPDFSDPVTRRAALASTEPVGGTLAGLRSSVDNLIAKMGAQGSGWMPADQGDRQLAIRQMPAITLSGIPTVHAPPTGVQQVTVTNPPPRPNVTVNINMPVTQQQDPAALANAVGAAVKREVESAYSDGGM